MKKIILAIPDILLFDLPIHSDERGVFLEVTRDRDLKSALGAIDFIQDNFSRSKPGVLRGLHLQNPNPQAKLVTVLSGKIFDVVVDVRKDSKTFGQHLTVTLDSQRPQLLFIPKGFAHGFCVLGDQPAEVFYKTDQYYESENQINILWNDQDLKINWPYENPFLSEKDQKAISLKSWIKS